MPWTRKQLIREWLIYYALELKVGAFIVVLAVAAWVVLARSPNITDRADWVQCQGFYAQAASASMGFHDLGLYEFPFLAAVIVPAFLYWSRQPGRQGSIS